MPSILSANTLSSGYDVANSVRFDDASNCQMRRAGVSGGNQDKFTLSMWIKRSAISTDHPRLFTSVASNDDRFEIYFENTDELHIEGVDNGTATLNLVTSRKFRDVAAWYHILLAVDTGQGTEANRAKLYINGVLETAFSTSTRPDQDGNIGINTNSFPLQIGEADNYGVDFDGYFAEIVFLDGTQAANTDLGEFDSDSGIWKPIDVEGLSSSKGNNGFYLDFEASGNLGNDVFGGTDFSEANLAAIDQSIDTCTNNFPTWNGLDFYHNATANTGSTSSEGNLRFANASGNKGFARSTFAVSAGKWYWEIEANSVGKGFYGVCHEGIMVDGTALQPSAVYYYENVPDFRSGDEIVTTNAVSISAGDILGFALDMDNYALYISKNGTYMNSGNPASGSSRTGSIAEEFTNGRAVLSDFGAIFANVANTSTSGALDASVNFGSPHYSESGGNADGKGFGNFKTAPPSGYLALCTKNLGSTGG